jgi:hypothetical protein
MWTDMCSDRSEKSDSRFHATGFIHTQQFSAEFLALTPIFSQSDHLLRHSNHLFRNVRDSSHHFLGISAIATTFSRRIEKCKVDSKLTSCLEFCQIIAKNFEFSLKRWLQWWNFRRIVAIMAEILIPKKGGRFS